MKLKVPTMRSALVYKHGRVSAKGKQIYRYLDNIKITLLCGFVTILVLRGTIGFGYSGAPPEDSNDLMPSLKLLEDMDAEEEDELEAELDLNQTYSLGPKIDNWDEQRRAWLLENPDLALSSNGKPRILLVTGSSPKPCDNPAGDHYLLKSIKNKIDYCRLHGIDIFYNLATLDAKMGEYWSKLPLIRKLMLAHPEMEWIWWMDSDAIFTDMVFELPLQKYENHNLIVHGWEKEVYVKQTWVGLNSGIYLIRNCQWSLDLMDAWAPMGPKGKIRDEAGKVLTDALAGRPAFEADDQSALIYLLITQKEMWGDKVLLENTYHLHAFWAAIVEHFEEYMEKSRLGHGDERWPFVTHFVGCKPCGSYGDYSVERCLKQIERAFNFGDNQVLQMYGFQHRSLDAFKVKRTRNDTDRPLEIPNALNLLHPSFSQPTWESAH
ncbi:hypothetical protein GOP47_0014801 [Adiantum capillus-veneris]|uniref:Xyloglucan 6-xylosyltransferase n=1 Tax=Adiantum capillus-veneris TaxID=13818 RepID=A0A9D4UNF0_ADICA|nr:hypothetical protein GOP47_0014801 [Adiantum capillus-veneris]